MTLSFWARTSGTWFNVFAVVTGTFIGLLLRGRLPEDMRRAVTQAIGLLTLWLGFSMAGQLSQARAGQADGVVLGLVALVLGGILGEWLQIEAQIARLGDWLKQRFQGKGRFTEGFVAASLLFCVGPMTLVGCLNNGLTGDRALLVLKSAMDGLVSIPFASTYGVGVGFSAIVILVYQGGLSLLAGAFAAIVPDPASDPRIALVTGIGGLTIMGIGLNLLEVAKIRVASFLPALALGPLAYWLASLF